MTLKDRLALSAYIEMLDEEIDLRNDSIGMRGGDPVRILLSEYDKLRAQLEGAVVVPELTEEEINARFWAYPAPSDDEHWLKWAHRDYRWAYHLAASRAHSVPSSRVLKDGEVAVGEAELVALRDLERLYRGTAMPSREMTKICVDLSKIRAPGDWESTPLMWRTDDALRTQATATESGKAREVEG